MKFSSEDIKAIDILSMYKAKNLTKGLEEYHSLLDTLVYLNETLAESKIEFPQWWTYSDTLTTKFVLHSHTFYSIASGITIQSRHYEEFSNVKVIDVPSLNIILRAQLEAFLMYHYIYVNPESEAEKEFRFDAWIYTSLIERQSMPGEADFAKAQKQKDAAELKKLEVKFAASPIFNSLSANQQTTLLKKGNARLFNSWKSLLKECGFGESHLFTNFYSILSNYAHSEALSILQIKASNFSYQDSNAQANMNVFISKQIICLMISSIIKLHSVVEERFDTLPQDIQDTVRVYSRIARHNPS